MVSVCVAEMGDKTQLFVIGLAAKHKITDVLVGVSLATVLLNAMGVFMGNVISRIFPMEYVSLAAGFFFLVFALLTIGKDDESKGVKRSSAFGIGIAFFLAELGDKTQLSAIAFSASNPEHSIGVFLGATIGMLIADGIGMLIARVIGKQIPDKFMKAVAYLIFTAFGFKTLIEHFYLFMPGKSTPLTLSIAAMYAFFSYIMLKSRKEECSP